MLDAYTIETFRPRVGETFRITVNASLVVSVELTSVDQLTNAGGRPRTPFSLLFHGEGDTILPQQTYTIENDALGPMEMFLVPIGPDRHGMAYEAIFT